MLQGCIEEPPIECLDTRLRRLALSGVSESEQHPHSIGNGNFKFGQASRPRQCVTSGDFRQHLCDGGNAGVATASLNVPLQLPFFDPPRSIIQEKQDNAVNSTDTRHRNGVQGSVPASAAAVATEDINSSAAAMRSQRSHNGRRTFTPAHCRSQDIGWPLSFETAAAKSQSMTSAGFSRRSLRCAAFASPQSLSYSMSRRRSSIGDSGSAPSACGNAETFGRWLSKKRCPSLSGSSDRVASSSIRPITNARAASKSAVRFTFRSAGNFHDNDNCSNHASAPATVSPSFKPTHSVSRLGDHQADPRKGTGVAAEHY